MSITDCYLVFPEGLPNIFDLIRNLWELGARCWLYLSASKAQPCALCLTVWVRLRPYMSCSKNVIIHRDLKPANLMIAGVPFDGGSREVAQMSGFVKIADFGLSRSLAINNPHSKTAPSKQMEEDRCLPTTLDSLPSLLHEPSWQGFCIGHPHICRAAFEFVWLWRLGFYSRIVHGALGSWGQVGI